MNVYDRRFRCQQVRSSPIGLYSLRAWSAHRSFLHVYIFYSAINYHYSVVGPSYFVVKFSMDDTISMIPRKNIVGATVPSVEDCCEVKWSNGEILMATVLAAGKCNKNVCK